MNIWISRSDAYFCPKRTASLFYNTFSAFEDLTYCFSLSMISYLQHCAITMSIRALHLAVTSRSVVSFLIMLSEEIENNDIKSSPDETSTMPNKRFVSSHKIACCFNGLITRSHSCQIHVFRLTDSRSLCCMRIKHLVRILAGQYILL